MSIGTMVHSLYLEPDKYYAKYNPTEGCENPKSEKERKFAEAIAAGVEPETAYKANFSTKFSIKDLEERHNRLKHYIECIKKGFSGNLPSPSEHLKVVEIVNSIKKSNPIDRIIENLRTLTGDKGWNFNYLAETMFLRESNNPNFIDLKGRVDILLYNQIGDYSIVDLKCTSGLGCKDFREISNSFDYYRELFFYSELVEGFTTEEGITLCNNVRNYIIAVDSDSPYGVQVYVPEQSYDFKLDINDITKYMNSSEEGRLECEMKPRLILI